MHATTPWYLLPQFRPARLQDCVFWLESDSFHGGIWRNLIPNSANTSHGIAYGGVGLSTWHPQFAPALEFYAGDEYVDLPLDIVFDDEMSIEFVFNIHSYRDAARILGSSDTRGEAYVLRHWINSSGHLRFYLGNGSYIYYAGFYINWYEKTHGVWTWQYDSSTNKTTLKAYKNGKYEHTNTFSGSPKMPNEWLRLSRWGSYGLDGVIYMARFYHKVLSDEEIRYNYTHHPIYYLQHGIDPYQVITAATAAAAPSI